MLSPCLPGSKKSKYTQGVLALYSSISQPLQGPHLYSKFPHPLREGKSSNECLEHVFEHALSPREPDRNSPTTVLWKPTVTPFNMNPSLYVLLHASRLIPFHLLLFCVQSRAAWSGGSPVICLHIPTVECSSIEAASKPPITSGHCFV